MKKEQLKDYLDKKIEEITKTLCDDNLYTPVVCCTTKELNAFSKKLPKKKK